MNSESSSGWVELQDLPTTSLLESQEHHTLTKRSLRRRWKPKCRQVSVFLVIGLVVVIAPFLWLHRGDDVSKNVHLPTPPFISKPDLPERKLTKYVNLLIGTEGSGHGNSPFYVLTVAFAGATSPFGMAKPVADSSTPWQNQAGFLHDYSRLKGISQMHDEGTGGTASLGNFPIWVNHCSGSDWSSCPTNMEGRTGRRVGEPSAQVGNFGIQIDSGFNFGKALTGRLFT
jgi:Glycosyl hydrolase family 92 N-terminal domain